MSEAKRKRPFIFGRVFFPGKSDPVPSVVRLQPLGDHVGNVKRLVKHWKDFPQIEGSCDRVVKAAELHDMAKPQRFSITTEPDPKKEPNGKFKKYSYSFRGHPYIVESPNLWAQTLARGHHDFSVQKISEDTYKLKKESPEYANFLSQDPLAYAYELYILEMCDQIEAELACRVIGDDEQAESRTFMDYTISTTQDEQTYLLDPWPFQDQEIKLSFKYWSKYLSEEEQKQLKTLRDRNEDNKLGNTLDRIVKTWWEAQTTNPQTENRHIILKPVSQKYLEPQNHQAIYQKLAGFKPNPMQEKMYDAIISTNDPVILLKGPTGTGKTESVLFPALVKGYRLILPLPAKSLLEDQKERIEKYLLDFSNPDIFPENKDREISMVVDTGSQMYRWVYKNGKDITATLNINLRRHLYKGDVILTTIDKFLYRYFSFGDKQKSFIFPFRINQPKTLICFDESHSYDEISFTNFQSLVQALYEAGRSLVLMTATMPNDLIKRFDFLKENVIDFIDDDENREELEKFQQQTLNRPYLNQRSFEWHNTIQCYQTNSEGQRDSTEFQNQVTKMILAQWELRGEATRILAVVETVKDAAAIYQQLKSTLNCDTSSENRWLFFYHGRIADKLRPELYKQIKHRDEKENSYILVTTSAIEVGCDLNAEVLISQICPPENLIQRAGRCNRRGNISDAKVILVGDRIPKVGEKDCSLTEAGWQKYQETLKSLQSSKKFDARTIGECLSHPYHVDDYRVIELFSMLQDYVYNADLTCQPAHEKGLVITRSWTPSATLIFDDGNHGDWQKNLANLPQVTVPIDRLSIKEVDKIPINKYANVDAYERYYDQEKTHYSFRPLRGGYAYSKDILIRIGKVNDGARHEPELSSYDYKKELGFIDLPGVFKRWKSIGFEERLRYEPKDGKGATLIYTKALSTETISGGL
ncbi:CRISPR-associated helicase Cas3' [Aerosakkonema funiforme]|uniref:CRISPR-associated helicase Cas3 n=1 Tax=Aerosakkonema funiforme FACHB-1375 TaxID=2949571 RepID=A0A926VHM4_9CYAN|nr:CRISPR-associated helicase Cas3' [Aerosakkonema funiforme]MBD2183919.1 CRISPR-associated helicase Cas3' [Aerosakkonema funiforme FACHB-1375]